MNASTMQELATKARAEAKRQADINRDATDRAAREWFEEHRLDLLDRCHKQIHEVALRGYGSTNIWFGEVVGSFAKHPGTVGTPVVSLLQEALVAEGYKVDGIRVSWGNGDE